MKYKIEMLLASGWADAEWTEDDKPRRFDSIEEGEAAIRELCRDVHDAVALGHMEDEYPLDEFRVVPAED